MNIKNKFLKRVGLVTLVIFTAAFLSRLFIVQDNFDFSYFIRGLASDFVTAFLIALPISALPINIAVYGGAALGSIIFVGNAEHAIFNSSNINFFFSSYGTHSQFISGSVLSKSFLSKLVLVGVISSAFARMALEFEKEAQRYCYPALLFSLALLTVMTSQSSRAESILESNIKNLFNRGHEIAKTEESAGENKIISDMLSVNLDGEKFVDLQGNKPNVIVILVESMNASMLHPNVMPNLYELSKHSLFYSNFMALNRLTNNGTFGVLCSQFPNIMTFDVKPELMNEGKINVDCLPNKLREVGYKSIYLQSADLNYMSKDRFLKIAGFDDYHGAEYFDRKKVSGEWGVDDNTLYEAATKIAVSEAEPYFLTILNTGTHPPYNSAPEEDKNLFRNVDPLLLEETREPNPDRLASYYYIDKKIGDLLEALKKAGRYDNSIIIITGDESGAREKMDVLSKMHTVLLPMIVLVPNQEPQEIKEYHAHVDIAPSIADLLGAQTTGFVGRSLFRKYSTPRSLVFSNVFTQNAFYLDNDLLTVCNFMDNCSSYKIEGDVLKDATYKEIPLSTEGKGILYDFAKTNDVHFNDNDVIFSAENKAFEAGQMIIGDQKLHVKEGDKIKISFNGTSSVSGLLNLKTASSKIGNTNRNIEIDENIPFDKNVSYEKIISIPQQEYFWMRLTFSSSEKPLLINKLVLERIKN